MLLQFSFGDKMDTLDLSYTLGHYIPITFNNKVIKIVNMFHVVELLDSVRSITTSNKINANFEKFVDIQLEEIYDPYVFIYIINKFINNNYYNISLDDIKPTLYSCFNKKINKTISPSSKSIEILGVNSQYLKLNYDTITYISKSVDVLRTTNSLDINIDRLDILFNNFKPYTLINHEYSYYEELINNRSQELLNINLITELTEGDYSLFLMKLLEKVISVDKHFIFYANAFITQCHIISPDSINNLKIYVNFLDIISVHLGEQINIDSYKYTLLSNYMSLLPAIEATKIENENNINYILDEMRKCSVKDNNYNLNKILKYLNINNSQWNSVIRIKSNNTSEYSGKIIEELKDYLYNISDNLPDISEDINNSILALCSISYELVRYFSDNNTIIEKVVNKLEMFHNHYLNIIDSVNPRVLTRITTLVSTYHNIKIRYNLHNEGLNRDKLIRDYYSSVHLLIEKNVAIIYEGGLKKILEDLGRIQMMMNYYDIKIDISNTFLAVYCKLNICMNFFYDYISKVLNIEGYTMAVEHGFAVIGASILNNTSIINIKNEHTNALSVEYHGIECFKQYLGIFNNIDKVSLYNNSNEYYFKAYNSNLDWSCIY